jgi:MoxR-like ATPase
MSDRQVSVDGQSRLLGSPFVVLATQNPFEFEGTFPLPESQLDRFLLRLQIGYPDRKAEMEILTTHRAGEPVEFLKPVLTAEEVVALQATVRAIRVDTSLSEYILDIVNATRVHRELMFGASPRAALGLYRAAQAAAVIDGRDYVVPDDVKGLVIPVLAHRLLTPGDRLPGRDLPSVEILTDILARAPVPA